MDNTCAPASAALREEAASARGRTGRLKERLLAVVAAAGPGEIAAMLDRLWPMGGFRVRQAPRVGMVMLTVRDPFDTPFHLGEVLASEAEVEFDAATGYGAVCGDEPERALLLAAVEAAERSGRTSVLACIGKFIVRLEATHAAQTGIPSKLAAATEVRFESMKKETVDFGSLGE